MNTLIPIGQEVLDLYKWRARLKKSGARTRFQEITEPYLAFIEWDNKTFESDLGLVWMSARRCFNRISEYDYLRRLEWIKIKNCLHPLAVVSTLNK